MSSDVFLISAAHGSRAPAAVQQAIELAGIGPSYIQDAIFGSDDAAPVPDADSLARAAGLSCPAACIATSLRAIFFAAASMLSDDVEISMVIGLDAVASTAFVLASPEAVGRLNLLPRARIAARSLDGSERALRAAGLVSTEVEIAKAGQNAAQLLYELLEELEAKGVRWGMLSTGRASILVERV